MPKIRYNHSSFSIGILNKQARGNTELEGWNNALADCSNMLVRQTGGLFKRGGTWFYDRTTNDTYLFSYKISSKIAYVIEFFDKPLPDGKVSCFARFLGKEGIVSYNGNIFELSLGRFTTAQLRGFQILLYSGKIYILSNVGVFNIYPSNVGAEPFVFVEMFYTVEPLSLPNTTSIGLRLKDKKKRGWKATVVDDDGNITENGTVEEFKMDIMNATEDTPHRWGEWSVGHYVALHYLVPGTGLALYYCTIQGFESVDGVDTLTLLIDVRNSPSSVEKGSDGVPLDTYKYEIPVTNDVVKWQDNLYHWINTNRVEDPFRQASGSVACIYENRLFIFDEYGIYASSYQDNDILNFRYGPNASDGLIFAPRYELLEAPLWCANGSKMFLGTSHGIYISGSSAYNDEAITPSNFRTRIFDRGAASDLTPLLAGSSVIFVGSDKKTVWEIILASETGTYQCNDISLICGELLESGITSHCFQEKPTPTYWCTVGNGDLVALTLLKNNNVMAWTRHDTYHYDKKTGEKVKSKIKQVSLLSYDGEDHLMLVVDRGGIQCIERMENIEPISDHKEHLYLDCAYKYDDKSDVIIMESDDDGKFGPSGDNQPLFIDDTNADIKCIIHKERKGTNDLWAFRRINFSFTTEDYIQFAKFLVSHLGEQEKVFPYSTENCSKYFYMDINDETGMASVSDVLSEYLVDSGHVLFFQGRVTANSKNTTVDEYNKVIRIIVNSNIRLSKFTFVQSGISLYNSASVDDEEYFVSNVTLENQSNNTVKLEMDVIFGDFDRLSEVLNGAFSSGNYVVIKFGIQIENVQFEGVPLKIENSLCVGARGVPLFSIEPKDGMIISNKIYMQLGSGDNSKIYQLIWNDGVYVSDSAVDYYEYVRDVVDPILDGVECRFSNSNNFHMKETSCFQMPSIIKYPEFTKKISFLFNSVKLSNFPVLDLMLKSNYEKLPKEQSNIDDLFCYDITDLEYFRLNDLHYRPLVNLIIGFPIYSTVETLPFVISLDTGTTVGMIASQVDLLMNLYRSSGGYYGTEFNNLNRIQYSNLDSNNFKLYTDTYKMPLVDSDTTYSQKLCISHSDPYSFNILSMTEEVMYPDNM